MIAFYIAELHKESHFKLMSMLAHALNSKIDTFLRTPNTNKYFLALVLTREKPSLSFKASNSSVEQDALFE